jgi:transcriptional antiterminator RfaH
MSENSDKKWLIAQLKPNAYDLAARNLERQGFEIFVPKMTKTIRKEKKFINKNLYVFPGYIFIGLVTENFKWKKINSTYGISKVLVFNKKPSEISNDLIIALKNRYETIPELKTKESLKKGDIIKFNNGPFVDLLARIENIEEQKRIWVLLEVMGGHRKLELKQTKTLKYVKV